MPLRLLGILFEKPEYFFKFPACLKCEKRVFLAPNRQFILMKKLFAVFCAIALLPMNSAQAWTGGPFSNNTYFGRGSEDGVYQAVASVRNGIAMYTIVVGNNTQGVNNEAVAATQPVQQVFQPGVVIVVPAVNSGNVFVGYYSGNSNVWFYEGVQYRGNTIGTVQPTFGKVFATAVANDNGGLGGNTVSSYFEGDIQKDGKYVASSAFRATGRASFVGGANDGEEFPITVFGSKVSDNIFFGL